MDDSIGGSKGVTDLRVQRTARPYEDELLDLRPTLAIAQVSSSILGWEAVRPPMQENCQKRTTGRAAVHTHAVPQGT